MHYSHYSLIIMPSIIGIIHPKISSFFYYENTTYQPINWLNGQTHLTVMSQFTALQQHFDKLCCENQVIKRKNQELCCNNRNLTAAITQTKCANASINAANNQLRCQNEGLKKKNAACKCQCEQIKKQICAIRDHNARIKCANDKLACENNDLNRRFAIMQQSVAGVMNCCNPCDPCNSCWWWMNRCQWSMIVVHPMLKL